MECYMASVFVDRGYGTSDDWDNLSPQARGHFIASIQFWDKRRKIENDRALKEAKEASKKK